MTSNFTVVRFAKTFSQLQEARKEAAKGPFPVAVCAASSVWLINLIHLLQSVKTKWVFHQPFGVALDTAFPERAEAAISAAEGTIWCSGIANLPVNFHDERSWPLTSHQLTRTVLMKYGSPGLSISSGLIKTDLVRIAWDWCCRNKMDLVHPENSFECCELLVWLILWTRIGNVYCLNEPLVKLQSKASPCTEALDDMRRLYTRLFLGQLN